jgi:hypothetical protein
MLIRLVGFRRLRRSEVFSADPGVYEILISRRSISTAPPRGGGHFLCCCKESNQRNSYPQPKHFTPAAAQAIGLMARQ